jgi:hypothetical protein
MFTLLSDPLWSKVIGSVLIILGLSFAYKSYLALVKGRVLYWQGWLPITLISPWLVHIPPKDPKNSLSQYNEAAWVHAIVGPLFVATSVLCLAAGTDLVGLPGTKMLNLAITGGRPGASDFLTFDPKTGYHAPGLNRTGISLSRIFNRQMGLDQEKKYYDTVPSYSDQTK